MILLPPYAPRNGDKAYVAHAAKHPAPVLMEGLRLTDTRR